MSSTEKTTVINESIENRHIEDCGTPPEINPQEQDYLSYYENKYGEQLAFVYNQEESEAVVYIGDGGWQRPIVFHDRDILEIEPDIHPNKLDVIASTGPEFEEMFEFAADLFGVDEDKSEIPTPMDDDYYEKQDIPPNEERIWMKACLLAAKPLAKASQDK